MILDLCFGEIVQARGEVPHRAVLRARFDAEWRLEEWIVHTQNLREDDTVDYGDGVYLHGTQGDCAYQMRKAVEEFAGRARRLGAAPLSRPDQVERFRRIAGPINDE